MDTIRKVKVWNMESRHGNLVPNQFIIETDNGVYFQSYQTIIAFRPKVEWGKVYLDEQNWNCSVTTGKYRNLFLGENIKETRRKIASGEYVLVDWLN